MIGATPPVPSSGLPVPRVPDIIFSNWREALHQSRLSPGIQTVYSMAVSGYLEYCAHNGISVSTASARAYMDDVLRRGLAREPQLWKDGLNWFFRTGREHTSARELSGVATLGQKLKNQFGLATQGDAALALGYCLIVLTGLQFGSLRSQRR